MTIKVTINEAGFRELLTSNATDDLVRGHAERMAADANAVPSTTDPESDLSYYEVEDGSDAERARYRVHTAYGINSTRAVRHEARTQALQKSL